MTQHNPRLPIGSLCRFEMQDWIRRINRNPSASTLRKKYRRPILDLALYPQTLLRLILFYLIFVGLAALAPPIYNKVVLSTAIEQPGLSADSSTQSASCLAEASVSHPLAPGQHESLPNILSAECKPTEMATGIDGKQYSSQTRESQDTSLRSAALPSHLPTLLAAQISLLILVSFVTALSTLAQQRQRSSVDLRIFLYYGRVRPTVSSCLGLSMVIGLHLTNLPNEILSLLSRPQSYFSSSYFSNAFAIGNYCWFLINLYLLARLVKVAFQWLDPKIRSEVRHYCFVDVSIFQGMLLKVLPQTRKLNDDLVTVAEVNLFGHKFTASICLRRETSGKFPNWKTEMPIRDSNIAELRDIYGLFFRLGLFAWAVCCLVVRMRRSLFASSSKSPETESQIVFLAGFHTDSSQNRFRCVRQGGQALGSIASAFFHLGLNYGTETSTLSVNGLILGLSDTLVDMSIQGSPNEFHSALFELVEFHALLIDVGSQWEDIDKRNLFADRGFGEQPEHTFSLYQYQSLLEVLYSDENLQQKYGERVFFVPALLLRKSELAMIYPDICHSILDISRKAFRILFLKRREGVGVDRILGGEWERRLPSLAPRLNDENVVRKRFFDHWRFLLFVGSATFYTRFLMDNSLSSAELWNRLWFKFLFLQRHAAISVDVAIMAAAEGDSISFGEAFQSILDGRELLRQLYSKKAKLPSSTDLARIGFLDHEPIVSKDGWMQVIEDVVAAGRSEDSNAQEFGYFCNLLFGMQRDALVCLILLSITRNAALASVSDFLVQFSGLLGDGGDSEVSAGCLSFVSMFCGAIRLRLRHEIDEGDDYGDPSFVDYYSRAASLREGALGNEAVGLAESISEFDRATALALLIVSFKEMEQGQGGELDKECAMILRESKLFLKRKCEVFDIVNKFISVVEELDSHEVGRILSVDMEAGERAIRSIRAVLQHTLDEVNRR